MNRSKWIVLACAVVLLVAAIAVLSSGKPTPGLIDGSQLTELQKQGARIVDVRTAAEFAGGHLPGAENVPLSGFAQASESWDPSVPVVLYCATGNRSAEAAQMLNARGFDSVYDLAGGVAAWTGPLEGGAEEPAAAAQPNPTGRPVMYEFYTDW